MLYQQSNSNQRIKTFVVRPKVRLRLVTWNAIKGQVVVPLSLNTPTIVI